MAMNYQHELSITTRGHGDMHDLTEQVAALVTTSGIRTGIANVFNVGSTAAVGTIEFETGLQRDLPSILDKLIPPSRGPRRARFSRAGVVAAAVMVTSRRGMTATAIRTFRQPCSVRP
jgi:thiamine phosphate synthase YjbQ (UPF0047 family)